MCVCQHFQSDGFDTDWPISFLKSVFLVHSRSFHTEIPDTFELDQKPTAPHVGEDSPYYVEAESEQPEELNKKALSIVNRVRDKLTGLYEHLLLNKYYQWVTLSSFNNHFFRGPLSLLGWNFATCDRCWPFKCNSM